MNLNCHICGSKYKLYDIIYQCNKSWIKSNYGYIYCCYEFNLKGFDCHSFISYVDNEIIAYDIQILKGNSGFILISNKSENNTKILPGLGEYGTECAILNIEKYYEPIIENNKLKMDGVLDKLLKLVVFK